MAVIAGGQEADSELHKDTCPEPEGRVESTGAPVPPIQAQGLQSPPQRGCCKDSNGTPTSQPCLRKPQLLFLAFKATHPHPMELHICPFPTSPRHCPTSEGCTWSPSVDSLRAQPRVLHRNFCSQATIAGGKGLPLGTRLGTSRSGGKKLCLFFFHALEGL